MRGDRHGSGNGQSRCDLATALRASSLNEVQYHMGVRLPSATARRVLLIGALPLLVCTSLLAAQSAPSSAVPGSPIVEAPEVAIYERAEYAVFKVFAGLSSGSAFLLDTLGGVLVTSAHVVEGQTDVSVLLDSLTRVPARVVERDAVADLALLRIDLHQCGSCAGLRLSNPAPGAPRLKPGERVIALGYPLHQSLSITAGIVSNVHADAVIADVNINPGNSGGPLLNMSGYVVAITTFIDQGLVGPGIGGAIPIELLAPLLAGLPAASGSTPPSGRLPVLAGRAYPARAFKALLDSVSSSPDLYIVDEDAGPFKVKIGTPVAQQIWIESRLRAWTGSRAQREANTGVPSDERYEDNLLSIHDWDTFVGRDARAVVSVSVEPKVGETLGSAVVRGISQAAIGYNPTATLKYQGDVRDVVLRRNGVQVAPLFGGHDAIPIQIGDRWAKLKDVADRGYYLYDPAVLAPDANGGVPHLTLAITDLKNPGNVRTIDLEALPIARSWNDFAGYYAAVNPSVAFRPYKIVKSCPAGPLATGGGAAACTYTVGP